ncbi:DNA repair protein rhp7-like [Arachis stenosperma]|uniref:DNA repair protein rhp7-like n=1 Tax=Arachis stenosperma TaxID=217475 RepID=UPI0025AD2868|nr:DNA repair protein rhp7-like [Arachis stenosperma]
MVPTKTTPKSSKTIDSMHPHTPTQTNEPSSFPPRRRSLRLNSIPNSDPPQFGAVDGSTATAVRVSNDTDSGPTGNAASGRGKRKGRSAVSGTATVKLDESGKGFLNLRSGKKVLMRGMEANQYNAVSNGDPGSGSAKRGRKTISQKSEEEEEEEQQKCETKDTNSYVDAVKIEKQNIDEGMENVVSGNRGKRKLGGGSSSRDAVTVEVGSMSVGRRRLSREEKGKSAVVANGEPPRNAVAHETTLENGSDAKLPSEEGNAVPVQMRARERSRDTNNNNNNNGNQREHGSNRMDRFRDIARENASRFAHFTAEDEENTNDNSVPEPEVEHEIEDWPGPFSTAMKIIRDREKKSFQTGSGPSERSLVESIKWVPKRNQALTGRKFLAPSLQELCLDILARNVDDIASLDSVPDSLRHRLSQLLCDSDRITDHFFGLLVCGSPTEIRLRNCSWLSEEHFIKCFQMCDTTNLVVLQLDQCGRCLADYVIYATLAQSRGHLPRLTSLSITGACRLSDLGLRALVSSAPALRSVNLSRCSLLTSSGIFHLAESLRSLLKELYLDECNGIDAALVLPALLELEHLEVLSVASVKTVCDEFVKDYITARGHNLKELVLQNCVNVTDASIKIIAEHCPGLCVLDIMHLETLTDLSIGYLSNHCRALHTLKLCRNHFSDEAIAAFLETSGESLQELSLNSVKKVGYHTALSLASHAKNLRALDLSWCRNLTDNALGLIVDSCSSLISLNLFGCTQVTDIFLKGHSNMQLEIIGLQNSPLLRHVKVPDPYQGALNYSSVSMDGV